MGFLQFLRGEWTDVKGNAKYDAYRAVAFLLVGGLVTAVWQFAKGMLQGLNAQQKWNFGIAFGLLLVIAIVAVVVSILATRRRGESKTAASPDEAQPSTPLLPSAAEKVEVDANKPHIKFVTARMDHIYISNDGSLIHAQFRGSGVYHARALVLVFTNDPFANRLVGECKRIRGRITIGDLQVPNAWWMGTLDSADFPVGATCELILVVETESGGDSKKFMAAEIRRTRAEVLPTHFTEIAASKFVAQVRLFAEGYSEEFKFDVEVWPKVQVTRRLA
ncbi:MAG: hypothetical protein QOE82_890 [Thermoanaerobaculia bacterium]|jgi:hypothetical protein|nr:hypothetical protein [Thermoanaerobaculia bacterium]